MLIGTKHSGYSRANIRLYFDPVTIMAAATTAETAAAVTAAEIAAAEAAAVAAAEAAAATAAAEAAAATAATEAAATAASAANAAPAFNPAGIMEIGGTTAPGATPLTAEAVNAAATQAGQPTAQEIYRQAANASINPGIVSDASSNLATQGTQMLPQQSFDFSSVDKLYNDALSKGAGPEAMSFDSFGNPVPVSSPAYSSADPTGLAQMALDANAAPPPSSLMKGLNSAMDWAKANKFETAVGAFTGAKALGLLDPDGQTPDDNSYDGPLSKYRLSPDFKGSTATPNIYKPTYPTYAAGGIMNAGPVQAMSDQNNAMGYQQAMAATGGQVANFVKGGRTGSMTDSLDYYKSMMDGKAPAAPSDRADVGIFRDSDPDTMYQDALTAAQIRNAKVNKRASLSVPSMKRPTPMGRINLAAPGIKSSDKEDVKEAAAGGIMGASSLGGYAAGGSPRLLRGPGDGMSDNIPAVIGKKQPARLADGEFVVPADVVSHLGNGSTEAGAKRLHEMMNKVRRDRTGNSKQGKQIVASKYMPK
jgi:hypothetical protein